MLHQAASKDSAPRTAWTKNSWYIVIFLMGAAEARASSWLDLPLPSSPGHRLWWGGMVPTPVTHYYWAQSVREVLPFCSQLLPREVNRSFLCIPSLLSVSNPNGGIHKVPVITWKPEWSKQTNSPQLKEPLQNNRENLTLCFFEQGLIMQVH